MSDSLSHVHKGFVSSGRTSTAPSTSPRSSRRRSTRSRLERNVDGPTLLQIGDSLLWVEAGDLPPDVEPWVGSVYVYVPDVDATYARAVQRGARSISAPETKPYGERQAGFVESWRKHVVGFDVPKLTNPRSSMVPLAQDSAHAPARCMDQSLAATMRCGLPVPAT